MQTFQVPDVAEFDALMQVEACGICGTDYEQFAGEMRADAFRTPSPAIPGHEPVGRIAAIGPGARERWSVQVGDRVAVRPVYGCGQCAACRAGQADGCRSRGGTYGLTDVAKPPHLWGGYAEYMYLHPLSTVVPVPERLSPAVATLVNPIACGISWAVDVPRTTAGDRVAILGVGQRGLSCVIAAKQAGAASIIVTGLPSDGHKLDLARQLGATDTIVVQEGIDVPAEIHAICGGADVIVDTTPLALGSLSQAIAATAQRGRVVSAGIKGRRPAPLVHQDDITLKQLSIFGVSATSAADFRAAARLLDSNVVDVNALHTMSFPLEQAEEAVLTAAGAQGRPRIIHAAVEPQA
jgi:threonine dehydrogenase-like Zn-dependent dehydrogenase